MTPAARSAGEILARMAGINLATSRLQRPAAYLDVLSRFLDAIQDDQELARLEAAGDERGARRRMTELAAAFAGEAAS